MPLRVYNTLTRRLEPFIPGDPSRVTFYSCGPTVYDDAHIGNFRSFLAADLLRRWVESPLCELATDASDPDNSAKAHRGPRTVVHVMNITDVGHMTDDAEGGEAGEDRMAVAGRRLAEAKKAGKVPAGVDPRDPRQIARFYERRFREDARKLGLKLVLEADKDPTLMPRATESVEGMKAVIERLLARGAAYVAGAPGSRVVYFSVQSFPSYGRLSGNTLERLREGAGGRISGEHQSQKKHPADFLLWKEDPRHIMKWPSPWGEGYPGWHIECSAMSFARLVGDDLNATVPDGLPLFDIHSGGEDNIFPHHECELAQTCSAFNQDPAGAPLARLWFHPRFLLVEGDKMSKSRGNFFTARDLFARGIEPAAVRLEIIKTHYRSNANFTMQGLKDSQARVERWRKYADRVHRRMAESSALSAGPIPSDLALGELETEFPLALSDDLNVARAIAALDRLCGDQFQQANQETIARDVERALGEPHAPLRNIDLPNQPMPLDEALSLWRSGKSDRTFRRHVGLLHLIDAVLGVIFAPRVQAAQTEIGVFAPGLAPDPAVIAKLVQRRDARAAKDFARSDAIRDELAAMGYAIKDVAGGRVEVRRL